MIKYQCVYVQLEANAPDLDMKPGVIPTTRTDTSTWTSVMPMQTGGAHLNPTATVQLSLLVSLELSGEENKSQTPQ